MDRLYQVFVSSTYNDLVEERKMVSQAILETGNIPTGMEIFPAIDEKKWVFIKKIIDEADYFVLIIGGKYGTLSDGNISYTEKEFDYAKEKHKKIIAIIHSAPEELAVKKSETNESKIQKLSLFREKVKNGRLVKYWKKPADLYGIVGISLNKSIKEFPGIGWIRGNELAKEEALEENVMLRKNIYDLDAELLILSNNVIEKKSVVEIFNDEYLIEFKINSENKILYYAGISNWGKIFNIITESIKSHNDEYSIRKNISALLFGKNIQNWKDIDLTHSCFQTIKLQFINSKLIESSLVYDTKGNPTINWKLSESGLSKVYELRQRK